MAKKEQPSLDELKEELKTRGILYQESPAWTTKDGALTVYGKTSILSIRQSATDADKRKAIQSALSPLTTRRARKEGQVLLPMRKRRSRRAPDNITAMAEWQTRRQ